MSEVPGKSVLIALYSTAMETMQRSVFETSDWKQPDGYGVFENNAFLE